MIVFAVMAAPSLGWACACGCGVFDVGTSSMLPEGPGGMAFFDFDYQDQNHNWSGSSRAPSANNDDKEIITSFATAGVQYMFDRSWGIEGEVPYVNRTFKTTDHSTAADGSDIANSVALSWGDIGDIRVKGIYTGFSPDLSTGVTFGFKLPTGSYTHHDALGNIDRDSEIGTGSTDALLGAFHRQHLMSGSPFSWVVQTQLDLPLLTRDQYKPGLEVDASAGIYYSGWSLGGVKITPIAQVIGSERTSDGGPNSASPVASGYQRILLSPGIEVKMHPVSVYADVELPVYQYYTGNQLVSSALFKLSVGYHF